MKEDLESQSYERLSEKLGYVLWSVNHADELILTLYEYTRAEKDLPLCVVSMMESVNIAITNLRSVIDEKQAIVTYDENLPEIIADESIMVQLIQNLVANGIKYNESTQPTVHISSSSQDDYWLFRIKDNGIGISQENSIVIFEPFKRLHGLDKYLGTGLGLATCTKIVHRHGGKLWVESDGDQGSTFCFTISKNLKVTDTDDSQ